MCFPEDFAVSVFETFVRELTEINTVLKLSVKWLHKVTFSLASRTLWLSSIVHTRSRLSLLRARELLDVCFPLVDRAHVGKSVLHLRIAKFVVVT